MALFLSHVFLFLSFWVSLSLSFFIHHTAWAVLEHGTLLFSPGMLKFTGTTTTAMLSFLSSLLSRKANHCVLLWSVESRLYLHVRHIVYH